MQRVLALAVLLASGAGVLAQNGLPAAQGRGTEPGRPARDVRERPTGTATLRGRVVTADTGTAIRRAQVRAVSANTSDSRLVITLTVSQETSINFALMAVRTARVSGRIVNSTGGPFNGTVMLAGSDNAAAPSAFGGGNRTRPDGTFVLTNVAPGTYTLTASSGGMGGRGGADAEPEMGSIPVTVAGEDLTGITLVTSRGATMRGVVSARNSDPKLELNRIQINTQALPFERGFGGGSRAGRVGPDGRFVVTNLFGTRAIRVNGIPQGWMLDTISLAGVDVTDRPVEFKPNQTIEGVEVVLTNRVTQVSGTVAGTDGKPLRDFSVVIFPDDETRWEPPSRYVRSGRPDQDGVFKITALPPASGYLAVAVDYLEQGEDGDPAFLDSIKNRATPFRLDAGGSTTIALKLVQR